MSDVPYAIGIDVGATNIKTVVVTPAGDVLDSRQFETVATSNAWATRVKKHVHEVERHRGAAEAIGIAAPGLVAPDGRSIAWMQGRLTSIQGLDWTDHLARESVVPILNDAHAALLAETWRGAAVGCRNAVLLTLGTGVGGAILCDGRLLRGHLGRAGHLGHLSLNPDGPLDITNTPGSLEDAIGDHTVSARAKGRFTTTLALIESLRDENPFAWEVWRRSVKALAAAIASIINAVDPERVILGGGITGAGDALFGPLNECLDRFEWRPAGRRVPIVPALLGEHAGAIGAARHALTFNPEGAV
ncbi:MAG TPA: ROK family protein [Tepidisphaeraceae bacterium]|nr:ROK family protein [Tepidisphaeraceae bacterium]